MGPAPLVLLSGPVRCGCVRRLRLRKLSRHRTRVWIDGVSEPLIASRTEGTILRDMGQEAAIAGPELDEALDLAARLAAAADAGRVDLGDLGRRARRLLASTTAST